MTSCPQCGIDSGFRTMKREHDGEIEVYVSCPHCPYEIVIRKGPREVVELELDVEHLRGLAAAGQPIHDVLERREIRLSEARVRYGVS